MLFRLMPNSMFKQIGFKKADGINLCNTMSELDFSDSLCTELDNSEFDKERKEKCVKNVTLMKIE
mgnify:FL=1